MTCASILPGSHALRSGTTNPGRRAAATLPDRCEFAPWTPTWDSPAVQGVFQSSGGNKAEFGCRRL